MEGTLTTFYFFHIIWKVRSALFFYVMNLPYKWKADALKRRITNFRPYMEDGTLLPYR